MDSNSSKKYSENSRPRILSEAEAIYERRKMTVEERFDLLMRLIKLNKHITKARLR